jgi:hypothetical protein
MVVVAGTAEGCGCYYNYFCMIVVVIKKFAYIANHCGVGCGAADGCMILIVIKKSA